MKIAFIGAGVMAEAMISGLIGKKTAAASDITASDIVEERLTYLQKTYGIGCSSDNTEVVNEKDVIVLSVKPQVVADVLSRLQGKVQPDQAILSIIAGTTIKTIGNQLGHDRIIRVMPNTPAQIGQGMSVWTATETVTDQQKKMAAKILSSLGKEMFVDDEKYIDMATALSGSGPAYIFLIIEALIDAGVHIGMTREMASELALQTTVGSALFAQESDKHPAQLRNMVTSPGGTTAAGLLKLEKAGIRAIMAQAVVAAYEKAQKLGKEQR